MYWPPEIVACPNTDNCMLPLNAGVLADPSIVLVFSVSEAHHATVFSACDRQIRHKFCDGAHSLPRSPWWTAEAANPLLFFLFLLTQYINYHHQPPLLVRVWPLFCRGGDRSIRRHPGSTQGLSGIAMLVTVMITVSQLILEIALSWPTLGAIWPDVRLYCSGQSLTNKRTRGH